MKETTEDKAVRMITELYEEYMKENQDKHYNEFMIYLAERINKSSEEDIDEEEEADEEFNERLRQALNYWRK